MGTTKSKRKPLKVEFKGYLRVNLTDDQEVDFDLWSPSQEVKLSDFDILLNNGYKFSLSWDEFHDGVTCGLMANSPKLAWSGWILNAWSDNVEDAIKLLFYKHYIICEEDWEHFYDVVEKSHRRRG